MDDGNFDFDIYLGGIAVPKKTKPSSLKSSLKPGLLDDDPKSKDDCVSANLDIEPTDDGVEERPLEPSLASRSECERFLIHALLVAGKTATFGTTKTDLLLKECLANESPFEFIRRMNEQNKLNALLREVKTGNYTKMENAFADIAKSTIDVANCTYADLRSIHGIGPKTARYFLMYSRPDSNSEFSVVLDRHTLHWLRDCGYKAPELTPQDEEEYLFWAKAFAREARKVKMSIREADTFAWNRYSKNEDKGRERARKAGSTRYTY